MTCTCSYLEGGSKLKGMSGGNLLTPTQELLFPKAFSQNLKQMRNNELYIPVAMTSEGVYACFMNACTTLSASPRCQYSTALIAFFFPPSCRNATLHPLVLPTPHSCNHSAQGAHAKVEVWLHSHGAREPHAAPAA